MEEEISILPLQHYIIVCTKKEKSTYNLDLKTVLLNTPKNGKKFVRM